MSSQISEAEIQRVVRAFYVEVQTDVLLAPIFATKIKVEQWDNHIAHIWDFWSSVFLKTGRYSGNPMAKHAALEGLTPAHFTRWLTLFQETTNRVLTPQKAEAMQVMANRIGQSLQMGLAYEYGKTGAIDHPFAAFGLAKPKS